MKHKSTVFEEVFEIAECENCCSQQWQLENNSRLTTFRLTTYRVTTYRVTTYRVTTYRVTTYRVTTYRVTTYRVTTISQDLILRIHK